MLAFFPWLTLSQHACSILHGFELLPYVRSQLPADKDPGLQRTLDRILEPYTDRTGHVVKSATILRLASCGIVDDLSEEQRGELFDLAELLAFAALSWRVFFTHGPYVNREDFALIIQSLSDAESGVAYVVRRRDGHVKGYLTRDAYRVQMPLHVNDDPPVVLDCQLLNALLRFRADDNWPQYWEAILTFNRANTDSSQVQEHTEAVMLVGAFERLLGCRAGKEDDLAEAFVTVFAPEQHLPIDKCARLVASPPLLDRYRHCRSSAEAWIRDFFRIRGGLAHGATVSRVPSAWSPREHLLLGSYAFPGLIKLSLAGWGAYALTKEDRFDIEVFEELACSPDLFTKVPGLGGGVMEWPWDQIRRKAKWRILSKL